jgi:UDPglucose 6-dehydrogenase
VSAYDPWANEEAKSDLLTSIRICQSLEECVDDVDCVLITTDWPEFKGIDTINLHNLVNKVVIDAVNCTELSELRNRGVKVTGIGRG